MINPVVRRRLQEFICDHGESLCEDEVCLVQMARNWVQWLRERDFPEEELVLFGVAYQAYVASKRKSERQMEAYRAAIATLAAKQGGVLRLDLDDIETLGEGMTMTSFVDPSGESITYRLISDNALRS